MTDEELKVLLQNSETFKESFSPEEQSLLLDQLATLPKEKKDFLLQVLETEKTKLAEIEQNKINIYENFKAKADAIMKKGFAAAASIVENDEHAKADATLATNLTQI